MSDVATVSVPLAVRPRRRWWAWVACVLAVGVALLAFVRAAPGSDQRQHLPAIWLSSAVVVGLLSWLAWLLMSTPPGARKLRPISSTALIFLIATLLRGTLLVTWWPSLSDDLFRYHHDGKAMLDGGKPYSYLPTSSTYAIHPFNFRPAHLPHRADLLCRLSNNAVLPTVYGPVSLWTFAAAAWIETHVCPSIGPHRRDAFPPPDGPAKDRLVVDLMHAPAMQPYRVLHTVADLGIVAVLLLLLHRAGRSLWWATLYAWHPLPLLEVAGNGHLESVGVLLLLGALLAWQGRRWGWVAALLALALLVKPLAILAVPAAAVAVWRAAGLPTAREKLRVLLRMAAVFGVVLVLMLLPFAGQLHDWITSFRVMGRYWYFNGYIFDAIRFQRFAGDQTHVREILGPWAIYAQGLILLLAFWRRWPLERTFGHAVLAFLIFSPQVYPWYVLWPLAFVPLAWHAGSWTLAWTSLLSYAVWTVYHATGYWELPNWLYGLEWAPVLVLAGYQVVADVVRVPGSGFRVPGGKSA